MRTPTVYAQDALRAATLRAELALSIVRALFCALIAVRFISIHLSGDMPDGWARGAVMLPPTILACAFSVALMYRLRTGSASNRLLTTSVVADAVVCTVAIGSNVLWPFPGYRGILLAPETATFFALVFAAGFRASYRLAVIGTIANGAGLAALTMLDRRINGALDSHGINILSLYAVLFGCTAALSMIGARRTERLVHEAATYSHRVHRAEQGLSVLLEEHHNALSLLSAALFGVQQLKRSDSQAEKVASLAEDLELLHRAVCGIREHALRELLVVCPPTRVSLRDALQAQRATFERMVAPMRIEWNIDDRADEVLVAGGAIALQRVMSNLLVNAREGNGRCGATCAIVRAACRDLDVAVQVQDDGPGFYEGGVTLSSKPTGTATGLRFVRAVVEASGGELRTENTRNGALVTIVLPVASANALESRPVSA